MSHATQLKLAETKQGRIILHFLTIFRDHKVKWHLYRILKEFKVA